MPMTSIMISHSIIFVKNDGQLETVHLLASSGAHESTQLIKMASEMGFVDNAEEIEKFELVLKAREGERDK